MARVQSCNSRGAVTNDVEMDLLSIHSNVVVDLLL
jgi:hypothetical protein